MQLQHLNRRCWYLKTFKRMLFAQNFPGCCYACKIVLIIPFFSQELVLYYFSAHWCPPCRRFTPMLAEFYKVKNSQFGWIWNSEHWIFDHPLRVEPLAFGSFVVFSSLHCSAFRRLHSLEWRSSLSQETRAKMPWSLTWRWFFFLIDSFGYWRSTIWRCN